ncbi:MAG: hypothetical protein JSS97_17860, partial [Actinobacteria bacterium]|nr:hypothetical protein [Actinomycetota bacterium]
MDEQPKPEKKGFFRSSFGSALLGGLVVAVVGSVLLLTGAVKSKGGGTTTVQQTMSAPVASTDSGGESGNEGGNTVDEIYKRDGNGVAFIESTIPPEESAESFNPFGEPESR